jgi:transcriptional antiterminator NusG
MTMEFKRGGITGSIIPIRPFAEHKQEKARENQRIQIRHISMASKRIAEDYPDLAKWFCLRVVSGREFLVEKSLKESGVDALVPTRKGDKIMKRHRIIPAPTLPVLPGYVLVRCVPSNAAMAGLRRFERVLDIVGGAETPYQIPLKFVSKFIEKAESGAYDHRYVELSGYMLGEQVRVADGPFASFFADVTAIDAEHARITVEVEIFGRKTPVELDIAQIEKV